MNVPLTRSDRRAPEEEYSPAPDPDARSPFELCPTPKMYPSRVASSPLSAMSSNSRDTAWRQPSCCASTPNTSSMSRNCCNAAASSARAAGMAAAADATAGSASAAPPDASLASAPRAHSQGAETTAAEASRTGTSRMMDFLRKCAHAATYRAKPRTVRSAARPSITTARPCTRNFSLPSIAMRSSVSFTATFLKRESTRSAYASRPAVSASMLGSALKLVAISSRIKRFRKGRMSLCVTASCTCSHPASAPA
mmetsp:Transcript_1439/g.6005  ORF Transcript_1439/g.6005 Transcript_1439/m.6005 type:complete len:253 (+) Transcript_1439:255-1013(+)